MPKTSRPTRSASSISSSRWCMRATGLSVRPVAGSEIAAAKLSIPICICVTSPTTFISIDRRTTPLFHRWLKHFGLTLGPQTLGALANLFQCRFKSLQLFRARIGKDFPDFGCVFAKNRRDQCFAFWRERHDADAPILRTLDPAYQAPFDEAVNGHADRSRGKVHLRPNRIHGQRSFVQKGLQYPEVGIVDSLLFQSRIKIFRGRPKRLPQYQPTVNRVSRVLIHDGTIFTFRVTDVQKNVSISIGCASIETRRHLTSGTHK